MIDKAYTPASIEYSWQDYWEKNGYYKPSKQGDAYCIMIPPPNVTGSLHMGHGFQLTLMDVLIRHKRMQSYNTLWQPGTDHAGIATQMVVERQLSQKNINKHDLGRDKFIEAVWAWKEKSGGQITQQMRRLGASVDWSRERFTMDEGLSKAVSEVFIRLFEQELIYRGKRLVNWDPKLKTAVSDLEVVNEPTKGHLWHIKYPLTDTDNFVVIATTRPETMLADVAVAVHPEDKRYLHLIGKTINLPLTKRKIPIIADQHVDSNFGTGCVKITPGHDFNDYEVGKRHNLPIINIFTPEANINENAPSEFQGLDRFSARKTLINLLTEQQLLAKTVPHDYVLPKGDRTGEILEPYLTDQWFIKMESLAKPAIDAVKQEKIKFYPENWTKTYYQWLENIQDWCISRQLWWGHRIPAWYDDEGKIYVAHTEQAVREKYNLSTEHTLKQDEDVLDTWFSSALWPFSTLGWPDNPDPDMSTFYPTNVLVTGFDIIFFWVARMVMMALKFTQKIPFHHVYITGLIRDSHGQKMSKSKGNILDPVDLIDGISLEALIEKRTSSLMQPQMAAKIEKLTRKEFPQGITGYGTDALRFTYCALATTGRDINFDISRLQGYANFCNKLWNAARYVNLQQTQIGKASNQVELSAFDAWIQSRFQSVLSQVNHHINTYRFDLLAQTCYDFVWHEFCDWYIELSKPILQNQKNSPLCQGTLNTLSHILEQILTLLHPIIPYITEEIWQKTSAYTNKSSKTIMTQTYPKQNATLIDTELELEINWLKSIITAIRTIRAEMQISPKTTIPMLLQHGNASDQARIEKYTQFITQLAKIGTINWLKAEESSPPAATQMINSLEIHIPLKGLINLDEAILRLDKKLEKLTKETDKLSTKLNNPNYIKQAPEHLVKQDKQLLDNYAQEKKKYKTQKQTLTKLL